MNIKQDRPIQVDEMDDKLQNRIWNVVNKWYFNPNFSYYHKRKRVLRSVLGLLDDVYGDYFGKVVGTTDIYEIRRKYFSLEWNEVYDFLEFILPYRRATPEIHFHAKYNEDYVPTNMDPEADTMGDNIRYELNSVLEDEFAGYRIIGNQVTPITNSIEISEITKAQQTSIQEINTL